MAGQGFNTTSNNSTTLVAPPTLPVAGDAGLSAADKQNVSALLAGTAWTGNVISYSFPTSGLFYGANAAAYGGNNAPFNGFAVLTTAQQNEAVRAFNMVESYTNVTFNQVTESNTVHAAIRMANTSTAEAPTAFARNPGSGVRDGDAFYGGTGGNPQPGNFDSGQALIHEIGHALGLDHGQDDITGQRTATTDTAS
jgi:hypothetical protein